jgi:LCP family protein required for cell wall assembly
MPEEPDYKVYRSRPRLFKRGDEKVVDGLQELRDEAPEAPRQPGAKPEYSTHRRRSLPRPSLRGLGNITGRRVLKWVASAIGGWLLLSLLLFLLSAQIQRDNVSEAARSALTDSGNTLTSANTILVLGSDARTEGLAEPGSVIGGPSRADSIMLIRAGAGKSAKLSIPRDTIVDIPGHGLDKINAAYAIGGPSLMINTIEDYLDIPVNHLVEVSFENFPEFIDSLGGITVKTGCVKSKINGGRKNGGTTLRLKAGDNHLNGKQALALARTRKNACNLADNDLTRAKHQQQVLSAIRSRLVSPPTFFRLPWVAWDAPKAIKSDMNGPSLLGLFASLQVGGDPKPVVLGSIQPDGGVAISDDEKARLVRKFLKG